MKIKHFAGYGCVNAKKIRDRLCTLHIRVTGNHEWGLYRNDSYDIYHWLVKRFDKTVPDYPEWRRALTTFSLQPSYNAETHEEQCDYIISWKEMK